MSESVSKHRKLWSASQRPYYSREPAIGNAVPSAITVEGVCQWKRKKLTVASGQGSLLDRELSWQGQGAE